MTEYKRFLTILKNYFGGTSTNMDNTTRTPSINIRIARNGSDKATVSLTIPQAMEQFFSRLSNASTKRSKRWMGADGTGARFYARERDDENAELRAWMERTGVFSDYGDGLYRANGEDGSNRERINIAFLRSVGASGTGGVQITADSFSEVTSVDLENYVRRLAEVSKELYVRFVIGAMSVQANITLQV